MTSLIRARGLTKVYHSGNQKVLALNDVDIDIPDGQVTVIVGPSGSGKSTMLNILGGMDHPTEGTIHCRDIAIHELDDKGLTTYRREQVGFVFQHYNLIPTLTAAENVGIGSYRKRRGGASLIDRNHLRPMDPVMALSQVGLGGRGGSFPYELSGGEMQRVAIARALAKRPALLLCDEPTGALDSRTGREVMRALTGTAKTTGTAVVIVTHNEDYTKLADQVIHLGDGRVVEARGAVAPAVERPAASVQRPATVRPDPVRPDPVRPGVAPRRPTPSTVPTVTTAPTVTTTPARRPTVPAAPAVRASPVPRPARMAEWTRARKADDEEWL